MRTTPYGERALIVDVDQSHDVMALHSALSEADIAGVEDLVTGARTLVVCYDPDVIGFDELTAHILCAPVKPVHTDTLPTVEISVRYDGADLIEVADLCQTSVDDVIQLHLGGDYTVGFCGFVPGFAYITGLNLRLHVPRHQSPKTRVNQGAVAIAGRYTGIYPRESPGGWMVIGHTDRPLWDPDRRPPSVLNPGVRVRFVRESG